MPASIESIVDVVGAWASETIGAGMIGSAYLFGSLVNNAGDGFNRQESDVDIVCLFKEDDASSAKARYEACRRLRTRIPKLELDLFMAMGRYNARDPICSVNLLSSWEADKCIHKDGARDLFFLKQFLPLVPHSQELVQVSTFVDNDFRAVNDGLIATFQHAQAMRNLYLKTNLHNENGFSVTTGSDPVPKKLMRVAASCSAFEQNLTGPGDLERVDPVEGIEFLTVVLNKEREGGDMDIKVLRRWLAGARRGRTTKSEMSRDQLLLLTELLVDRARKTVRSSAIDKMAAAIGRSGA